MPKRTSVDIRQVVIKLHNAGKVSREISQIVDIGKSTVNDIINRFNSTNTLKDKKCSGRPRKTNNRVDKVIKRKMLKRMLPLLHANYEENLADVSESTVSRRLREVGLFGRVGVKKPLISKKNKKATLEFTTEHQSWTVEDWKKVLFSDETKICLFGNFGRRYVRRPKGSSYDSRYQIPTVKHGGGSIRCYGVHFHGKASVQSFK